MWNVVVLAGWPVSIVLLRNVLCFHIFRPSVLLIRTLDLRAGEYEPVFGLVGGECV